MVTTEASSAAGDDGLPSGDREREGAGHGDAGAIIGRVFVVNVLRGELQASSGESSFGGDGSVARDLAPQRAVCPGSCC